MERLESLIHQFATLLHWWLRHW